MTKKPKILALAGSLRKDSYNKKLVKIAAAAAEQAGAQVTYIDLADYPMPIFDEDLEAKSGIPENGLKLKKLMEAADGLIIASPEYNSSLSAALKNFIDWVSRQKDKEDKFLSAFNHKTALILSASPGPLGGLRGLVHLRSILGNINVHVLPGQKSIVSAFQAFDESGNLKNEKDQNEVKGLAKNLVEVTEKLIN
jgi:NAD(P)H-dependent FMN reductase